MSFSLVFSHICTMLCFTLAAVENSTIPSQLPSEKTCWIMNLPVLWRCSSLECSCNMYRLIDYRSEVKGICYWLLMYTWTMSLTILLLQVTICKKSVALSWNSNLKNRHSWHVAVSFTKSFIHNLQYLLVSGRVDRESNTKTAKPNS